MFMLSNEINLSAMPQADQERIASILENAKAANTKLAYESDWNNFKQFCSKFNYLPLPASEATLIHFISEESKTCKHSTIKRKISSISKAHKMAKLMSNTTHPIVEELMDSIARTKGNHSTSKKAMVLDDLKRIIDVIDTSTLQGKRDKALILLGWSTALRRGDIVSINMEDLVFTDKGLEIDVFEQKKKKQRKIVILPANNNYCPIETLLVWLKEARIKSDSIFRAVNKANNVGERLSGESVADIVKKHAKAAGLNPELYAGHSLRSGHITAAHDEGFDLSTIRQHTGHSSIEIIDRHYVQTMNNYKNNTSSTLSKL
ncbi:hypothetical protein BC351_10395 [Paenibacillus ferrarius]|uniref:Integrase n=1 Tax=Paenibacillus ferrarius TaxID=1469647 RepID=A0A1V4H9E1_9BACL|nr:site-specific integrase [Paenibacillus ferrarius]OPH47592.1 hypothetical protein BC351_10395 [Paenibacillus ferrarius]